MTSNGRMTERSCSISGRMDDVLFKSIGIATVIAGNGAGILLANREFEKLSGYSKNELENTKKWTDFLSGTDSAKKKEIREFVKSEPKRRPQNRRFTFLDRKGATKNVIVTKTELAGDGDGKAVISFINITDMIEWGERTRLSEEKYRSLIESTEDSIYMVDKDCRFLFVNGRVLARYNIKEKNIIGKKYGDFHPPNDTKEFENNLFKVFKTGVSCQYEYKARKQNRFTLRTMSPILDESTGKVKYVAIISKDITELKKTEEKLKYLSLHDPLTGLYNRAYFEEEMHRLDNSRVGLVGMIVCDVDGLKLINDTLGHNKGDQLLVMASEVLRKSFREGDVVARVGGDEFAILLPNSPRPKVESICQRMKHAVAAYSKKNSLFPLSIATGFAIRENPNQSMVELFREADNNMYKEKLYSSQNARNAIVKNLISTEESRGVLDKESSKRFQDLTLMLARAAGLDKKRMKDLELLAQFHDIGNISVPDRILNKPGSVTPDEFVEIQKHSDVGHRIAQSAPDLAHISEYILKHHEWWNGNGYPLGSRRNEIPIESRIIAIVDAYESMTRGRPHRASLSKNEALAELRKYAGTQFDPSLVNKFIQLVND
ncbi:MAG TPA: HD domain-containing phosphohydrolase [Syntrophorhabdaceae bacterium]|nr:HD domain-containing phosphohydrolase [Syntrophorhabdaceae bacterium]